MRFFGLIALLSPLLGGVAAAQIVDFERDIRPIFSGRCVSCHGPKKQESKLRLDQEGPALRGGVSGEPAIVPGHSDRSELIRRVTTDNEEERMPGKGDRLTPRQIALLREWIDRGAEWPGEGDPRLTTDHWSFQPIKDPPAPELEDPWAAEPIDAFILARLKENGLRPAPPADRITLIRRLTLDMHGLPPKPEQVERFLRDKRPGAYARLVERVLASPRTGERWAQHWLDVVHYADTHGFEMNQPRPNAWHYRDYVIRAFNEDKPYDRFVFEQLAGDSVGVDAATGFLVAGPWDQVENKVKSFALAKRQDELADMINTSGTALLGLTLGCARCHNHKFDPVLQKDFYSLQAIFAGVRHGDRPLRSPETERRRKELGDMSRRTEVLRNQLDRFERLASPRTIRIDDERSDGARLLVKKSGHGVAPRGRYTYWENRPGADFMVYSPAAEGRYRIWLSWGCGWATHTRDAIYLLDQDGDPETRDDQRVISTVDQQPFGGEIVSKPHWSGFHDAGVHELKPASTIVLRGGKTGSAITADVIVLQKPGSGDGPRLRSPVNPRRNVERFAPVNARFVRFTILATNNGIEPCIDELEIRSGDRNVAPGARVTSSGDYPNNPKHKLEHINDGRYGNPRSWISNERGKGWVQLELAEPAKIDRIVWGRDRQQRYRDRLPTRYRIETAMEAGKWQLVAVGDDRGNVPIHDFAGRAKEIFDELKVLEARQKKLEAALSVRVYGGTFSRPGPTHRLFRGDPLSRREVVAPDTLSVLGTLGLKADAPELERRAALARWVTDPKNPLTARVMVNRLWHYHFGAGIVRTPSDFGRNGSKPTHPELLDWLATQFIRGGWSVKKMHRLILMSNAYRQSSAPREDGLKRDATSRWLWRFPPRRLEAEAIRDGVLHVTGALDLKMGGPGFSLFKPNNNYVRVYDPKEKFGPAEWRRMIYAQKVRMEKDGVFGAFDTPDAGQVCPKRERSTTPIQALNLFNSAFMVQQSERFAERLRKEAGDRPEAQVRRAFALVFAREPNSTEARAARRTVEDHGLPAFCRAILNTNEFLFMP